MIRNLITLLFISLFVSQFARAQDVSTLVTDSTKRFAAMHWHEDGRIYAVDYYNGNLYQVYLDGTVRTILDEFRNLAGGGFDHAGNFYFSDIAGGILYKLNADETYTSIATGMKQPVMILQDPQNDSILYITEYENSQVTRIVKETGAKSVVVKGRGINGPDGIFYDWDGNMMVSNWNNHKIHIVNPDGSTTLFANIPVGGFMGYALLIGDYIYVPSVGHKKLYRIDKSGNVEHIAGSGAIGSDDGNGLAASFVGPNGTCKSPTGDTLLISDDHRIRIVTKLTEGTSTAITSIIATDFTVSPNPVSDMLHITWSIEAQSELNYEIYTIEGSKIMLTGKTKVSQGKAEVDIDVTQLKRGLYFITFTDSKGRQLSHNFLKS